MSHLTSSLIWVRSRRTWGEIVAFGHPSTLNGSPITGEYLSGVRNIEGTGEQKRGFRKTLLLKGASGNNLKNVDLHIPRKIYLCDRCQRFRKIHTHNGNTFQNSFAEILQDSRKDLAL
ncbi:MAG: hypothetical protein IPG02_15840 [Ignavibacteria bacterium]|nr:hypothetical protein [Ignavibacteria bacterium]